MTVSDYADWSDDQMPNAAATHERAMNPDALAKHLAWKKVGALEAMATDHQGRAELLLEAAKAIRTQAGLPESD